MQYLIFAYCNTPNPELFCTLQYIPVATRHKCYTTGTLPVYATPVSLSHRIAIPQSYFWNHVAIRKDKVLHSTPTLLDLLTCSPAYLVTCLPGYLLTCLPAYLLTCLPAYLPTC